jgi:hypothetical protein
VQVPTVESLQEIAVANTGVLKQDMLVEGKPVTFKGLPAGTHTVCAIGLPDVLDAQVIERLQRDPNSLPFACVATQVKDGANSVTIPIPPTPKPPE